MLFSKWITVSLLLPALDLAVWDIYVWHEAPRCHPWTLWSCYKSWDFKGCKVLGPDSKCQKPFFVAPLLCGCHLAGMGTWEVTGGYKGILVCEAFSFDWTEALPVPHSLVDNIWRMSQQENSLHLCLSRSESSERWETGSDDNWYLVCIYISKKLKNDYASNQLKVVMSKACK